MVFTDVFCHGDITFLLKGMKKINLPIGRFNMM